MSEEIIDGINLEMAQFTKPSLSAVYGIINQSKGSLFGSGTFINFHNSTYLITAGHVLETPSRFQGLAHSCSDGNKPSIFKYPKIVLKNTIDLGIVRIDSKILNNTSIVPLDANSLAYSSNDIKDNLFFIHGYLGKKSQFMQRIVNGVVSKSQPYITVLGASGYSWFNEKFHFALEYPAEPQMKGYILPNPYGLSGSAVWSIEYDSNWDAEKAKIIGIVHTWDPHQESLVATRIEIVRDFILKYLRKECAYFNWLSRGKPTGDDLLDWYYACNEIKDL